MSFETDSAGGAPSGRERDQPRAETLSGSEVMELMSATRSADVPEGAGSSSDEPD